MSLPATREQLLALKQQTEAVRRGKSLLEKKRDALLRAIEQDRKVFASLRERFARLARKAGLASAMLRLYEGQFALDLLRPGQGILPVEAIRRSLMGCTYLQFAPQRDESERMGWSYDPAQASIFVDDLLGALGEMEEILWPYLNVRAKLLALEQELQRTLRKVNNLEHRVLPGLLAEYCRIREILMERERQERYTLMKISRRKEKRRLHERRKASLMEALPS